MMGQKFKTVAEIKQKVSSLGERWSLRLVPAICQLAKETGKVPPTSDIPDGEYTNVNLISVTKRIHMIWFIIYVYCIHVLVELSMYCLKTMAEKLKPRTGKSTLEERVNAIIYFSSVC